MAVIHRINARINLLVFDSCEMRHARAELRGVIAPIVIADRPGWLQACDDGARVCAHQLHSQGLCCLTVRLSQGHHGFGQCQREIVPTPARREVNAMVGLAFVALKAHRHLPQLFGNPRGGFRVWSGNRMRRGRRNPRHRTPEQRSHYLQQQQQNSWQNDGWISTRRGDGHRSCV